MSIKGIVRVANQVRKHLSVGIKAQDVASFQKFISDIVYSIERICTEANTSPIDLPTPSRQAYYYLKNIDLDNLPLTQDNTGSGAVPTLRLKNVLKQQKAIQQQIFQIVDSSNIVPSKIELMSQTLERCVAEIEEICTKNNGSPAALNQPSRQVYALMKFLTNKNNLLLHLNTVNRAKIIGEKIIRTQLNGIGENIIELHNYSGLYKYKKKDNLTTIILSEGFIQAEDEILNAIMTAILLGKTAESEQRVRNFGLTEEYSDVLLELDLIVDVTAEIAKGNCYDLDDLFEAINQEYFSGQMLSPRLTWNKTLTHRKFGHYEQVRDRVVMSQTLDSPNVPRFVVEFVLYHELLHKQYGAKYINGKRRVHTPEFRRTEQQFKHYQEAEQWLHRLAKSN